MKADQIVMIQFCVTMFPFPSLLQSGGEGVRGWVGEALAPVDAALAAGKFKGQEALHAELHKT